MTTRFYYNHAHHALCMMLDHGMSFTRTETIRGDGTRGESTRPITSWILARDIENQVLERVRYYLTDDSVAMLEPRVGDVLYTKLGRGQVSVEEIMSEERQSQSHYIVARGGRIIQRDSCSFYWPDQAA